MIEMIPYEKVKKMCLSIGLIEMHDMKTIVSDYHFFSMPYNINENGLNPVLVTYYSKFGCNVFLPNNEQLEPWVVSEERLAKALEKLEEEICKYRKEQKLNSIRKSCAEFET